MTTVLLRFCFYVLLTVTVFSNVVEAQQSGASAAISGPIVGSSHLEILASSQTEKRKWTIYVVQTDNNAAYLRTLASFTFGRSQDPFVYSSTSTTVIPFGTDATKPYRIAVYFYNTDLPIMPSPAPANNMATGFQLHNYPDGRPQNLVANYWDRQEDQSAQIHHVTINFDYSPQPKNAKGVTSAY